MPVPVPVNGTGTDTDTGTGAVTLRRVQVTIPDSKANVAPFWIKAGEPIRAIYLFQPDGHQALRVAPTLWHGVAQTLWHTMI